VPVHVGQPVAPTLVLEHEPLVVDAEQVQQRRLEVVDVHRVTHHVVAELVGLAVAEARLDAAAAILGKQACALAVVTRGADRLMVGLGMIPRGEVGLIFAGMGLTLRIDGQPLLGSGEFAAVVAMVLLTTVLTPPLLKWRVGRQRREDVPQVA
jgi:Kef-type K+ transport system membrane component KefB